MTANGADFGGWFRIGWYGRGTLASTGKEKFTTASPAAFVGVRAWNVMGVERGKIERAGDGNCRGDCRGDRRRTSSVPGDKKAEVVAATVASEDRELC
jgi:hypothetical protein